MNLRLLAAATAASLALAACSSSSDSSPKASPEPSQGTAKPLVEVSPLTGKPMKKGRPDHPVFVVKIENTAGGAPQYGLDKADLVLEELVEGGLTRLAAFYYSELPSKVGHVRSLRTSDIGIAGPVGGQIVASGGATGAFNKVKDAGIKVFSEDDGAPGFSSDPLKVRPYNRLIDLKTVARSARKTPIPGPYLPWSDGTEAKPAPAKTSSSPDATGSTATTPAPKRATAATVRFSNTTTTSWALKGDKWVRTNGHAEAGKDFEADTMIVLSCRVGDAGYTDPAGNPVPETVFEGSGEARVFHGNRVTSVTWVKPGLEKGLRFRTADGKPYRIDPGKVFLELVPRDAGGVTFN